jgi:lipopolysaccharide transport protein LptA
VEQEVLSDFEFIELFPNEGLTILKGAADKPACIDQGTMRICGNEIRLEQADDGSLKKVTATGAPVRFQQQVEADQELSYLSGQVLVFDNTGQLLTVDGDAEFSQAGNVLTHDHIEYDLESGRVSANSSNDGERGQMMVSPQPNTSN